MKIDLYQGDCRDILKLLGDDSVDAVVTDPPYELGFMGKKWDGTGIANSVEMWSECLRVLKPGGHLLAFGGTRTYHRMACAIEDAGFEIRDCLQWLYGSGFPKSLNVSKAIDAANGDERPVVGLHPSPCGTRDRLAMGAGWQDAPSVTSAAWDGWGTALKPAYEPIILARKPLDGTVAANVQRWGTGALNIDATRIETDDKMSFSKAAPYTDANGVQGRTWNPTSTPGMEREQSALGRWPANVILDEEAGAILDAQTGNDCGAKARASGPKRSGSSSSRNNFAGTGDAEAPFHADTGGASRFFYCAKTATSEREAGLEHLPKKSAGELTDREDGTDGLKSPRAGAGRTSEGRANIHPTVKPIALMRYLIRLVTPPDGIVLDPFMGSGSTGCAAVLEGFNFTGIEMDEGYIKIAKARIDHSKTLERPKTDADGVNDVVA